jgi:c-di-GMP-binding flagellar brake protein YcgR
MLNNFISPGDRVELTAVDRKLDGSDKNENARYYETKIVDILSEDSIEVQMPIEQTKLILLPVDAEFNMIVYTNSGLYQCFVRVIDRYKSNNIYVLVMELTSNLRKYQRREYYRFSCALELKSRICTKEELEAFEKNRKYLVDPGDDLQRSVVVDISGGGLRFAANFQYEEGSTIYCAYHLPGRANDKEYQMICNVLKVQELESRPGLFEHRIQYIYIDENSREDIIHFIFEEERKIRKKQT